MTKIVLYLLVGLLDGIISDFINIGGGVFIVPALIFLIWIYTAHFSYAAVSFCAK